MIERGIQPLLREALTRQAAVVLLGPRQVGKTTLAQEIGKEEEAVYLDLEWPEDRQKLQNPSLFFERYEDNLSFLMRSIGFLKYFNRCGQLSTGEEGKVRGQGGFCFWVRHPLNY